MPTSNQLGAVAETAIVFHAARLGVGVLRPVTDGFRYDLVFDVDGRLMRIQCKWAQRQGDVVVVRCRTSRRGPEGFIRRCYSAEEVDGVAAYCADLDRCYLVPPQLFAGRTMVLLRLAAAKNNQRARIHWAENYEFAATLGALGAIAQLGERLHGMQEVAGSSPAGSTSDLHEEGVLHLL